MTLRRRFWLSMAWVAWWLRLRGRLYNFAAGRYCVACGGGEDDHLYF